MASGRTVRPQIVKAMAEALTYRDFSHWRRLEKWSYDHFTFLLDLGEGYRLYAHPESGSAPRKMYFDLLYNGEFMFGMSGKPRSIDHAGMEIGGDDCTVQVRFDGSVEPELYAESVKDDMQKVRLTYEDLFGNTGTSEVFASDSPYHGCEESPVQEVPFGWEFKRCLMKAVLMQDLSELQSFIQSGEHIQGGIVFSFNDTKEVMYSCRYSVTVISDTDASVSFRMKGILTMDKDGILIRGGDASFSIRITEDDMVRFREETGFPTPEEYLEQHPYVSYRDVGQRYADEISESIEPGDIDW